MRVFRTDNTLSLVRLDMALNEFPHYLTIGIGNNGRLAKTERLGRELIDGNFEQQASLEFVRKVCLWGDDPRRAGKIIKLNTSDQISKVLRKAYEHSRNDQIVDALKVVIELKGLAVSFGSKHLKFLDPNRHVVLDTIISERLGYRRDEDGYGYLEFLSVCREFLEMVVAENVPYPGIGKSGWRVSDIEMAIFNKIRSE